MARPEFQYKDLQSPLSRNLLQEAINQDEGYFSDYIPPARDAIIIITTSKYVLYILIGAVVIVVGTYGITSHLIKDLLHDLADWLLGPDPEENEEEEEEVLEVPGAGERKNKQEEKHRSSSGDQNNPGFKLSTIS
ncbi:hypothetical protein KOW79_004571 [Hemibagrus wyckioides]|uniref:Uncharacterized protein n=1 Tax=Hemibagrus wyckioides TaxID=337641 RepID=A0A9D3SQF3_9TELE|nr:hypothetical protein KOW79_004571 [Hemibagrus wyckioides]